MINITEYKIQLTKAKVAEKDVSLIIRCLELLKRDGVSAGNLDIIVKNITAKPEFKASFMKDYKGAVKRIGINPVPSP